MSYILDALKKIELEKNNKTNRDGRISISGDLFLERKQSAVSTGIWKIALLLSVASLLTCAGTWFVLKGNGKNVTAVIRPAVHIPSTPVAHPPVAPVIAVPIQSPPAPVSVPPATGAVAQRNSAPAATDDSSVQERPSSKKQLRLPPSSPKQPVQAVQAPTDIKLSGIAWQDEHSGRRAVVNGFLLKEGAVVSGAKIIDIQADRVRFSSPSGAFDLKLDAVLPAGVQR